MGDTAPMTAYRFSTVADHPRHPAVFHFARMWAGRNDEPRLLPNGRDFTDPRASLRDNLRGQRAFRAYEAQI